MDFTIKLQLLLAVTVVLTNLVLCGETNTKCLSNCKKDQRSVCAKNRNGNWKTFQSHCDLANYNCLHDDAYDFIAFDDCSYYLL